jgi:hypothetical protein
MRRRPEVSSLGFASHLAGGAQSLAAETLGWRRPLDAMPSRRLLLLVYPDDRLGGWLNLIDRGKLQALFERESGRLAVKARQPGYLSFRR